MYSRPPGRVARVICLLYVHLTTPMISSRIGIPKHKLTCCFAVQLRCVVYSSLLGIDGEVPNGTGRKPCPNHYCMRLSGRTSTSSINCIAMDNPSSGSLQETSRRSLAGWTSTELFGFLGKQGGYRSSKKRGVAEQGIGMPTAPTIATPASAIWDGPSRGR